MTPQIPSNEFPPPQQDEMMMTMLTTFATLTSRSTVGVLIVGGLVSQLPTVFFHCENVKVGKESIYFPCEKKKKILYKMGAIK